MWFPLAFGAMMMLVARRGVETKLVGHLPATAMAWLQPLLMLPFVTLLLLFWPGATVTSPLDLGLQFWLVLAIYVAIGVIDGMLYFKALSLGDVSVLSSVLSLGIVSNLLGVYVILGQIPSKLGLIASAVILVGAYLASRRLASPHDADVKAHKLALLLILVVVVVRGLYSPLEVIEMRTVDPFYFNFLQISAVIPATMAAAYWRGRQSGVPAFSRKLAQLIGRHWIGLLIVGLTFAINVTFTMVAKTLADNAAYVTTVKSASVLPMMILGVVVFKEHVRKRQWLGLAFILVGLVLFSQA